MADVKEFFEIDDFLAERTKKENEVIKLISELKYDEAMELMKTF